MKIKSICRNHTALSKQALYTTAETLADSHD